MSADDVALPDHVRRNRVLWDGYAAEYAAPGERAWATVEIGGEHPELRVRHGPGDLGVEFHLSHGDWIRVLRRSGFDIEDLIEVRAPEDGTTRYQYVTREWARQWPAEEIWKVRRQ